MSGHVNKHINIRLTGSQRDKIMGKDRILTAVLILPQTCVHTVKCISNVCIFFLMSWLSITALLDLNRNMM